MPETGFDTDVIVIGGGPGGYPCAIRCAQLGAKVTVIEADNPGGTCLNWGCIPTKTMIGSVDALHTLKTAKSFGLKADNVGFDFSEIMARKDGVVKKLVGGVGYLFKKHGITHVEGYASLADKNTVKIAKPDGSEQTLRAPNIVIATGSVPAKPPIPGVQDTDIFTANRDVKLKAQAGTLATGKVWTSNEAVSAKAVPQELIVIGGGIIGCEFAYTYTGLGAKVTILEFLPKLIANMDADLSTEMEKSLKKQGITVKTGARVTQVTDGDGSKKTVTFETDKGTQTVSGDVILVATSRVPFTEGLNLEGVGVTVGTERNKRAVKVDHRMQTNVPGIWSIGDVTGSGLAHTATAEGLVCAENICGHETTMDYKAIPSCIYTEPEVAAVGLTEQEARDKGFDVQIGTMPFRTLGKAMAINQLDGFVKVVAEKKYGEILGVHIIGPHATDLIHEAVVSIQLENTVEELMKTVHAHPSLAEAVGLANEDVKGLAIDKG